ncbi:MAG: HAD-IA family hydrolase [Fuerstiella sp.]
MNYRLLIWDFDGTLVDSLEIALEVYRKLQASFDLPPIDDPEAVRDLSLTQFLSQFEIPVRRVPFLFTAFLREFRSRLDSVTLHDGIRDVLQGLHAEGVRHAVISSNSKANIQQCLKSHQLDGLFDFVIGTSRVHGKQRRITKALKSVRQSAKNVLYVGDEVRDVEACREIPLDVVAVEWGLNTAKALRESGPTYQVSRPHQLWDIVGLPCTHRQSIDGPSVVDL